MSELLKTNKELHFKELRDSKIELDSKPLGAVVLLTSRCNISCIMCGWWKDKAMDLPYKSVKKLFPLMPYMEMVNWQGGEPFIVPYFKKLYKEVAQKFPDLKQSISTNGLLIDEEWADILAKSHLDITFSIDGVDKETYEHIRRGGNFEILLQNIKRLNTAINKSGNNRIWKTLFVVIMKSNYKDLNKFLDFAIKYGFNRLQFAQESGNLPEEQLFIPPDNSAIAEIKEQLKKMEQAAEKKSVIMTHPFDLTVSEIKTEQEKNASITKEAKEKSKQCDLPWYKLTVLPNGDVKPDCVCVRKIGNLLTDDILELWNGPVMKEYRTRILENNIQGFCADICNRGQYLGIKLNKDL